MARDLEFIKQIEKSFIKTKKVQKTAQELNLDVSLVRYWLRKQGFDLRGQNVYKRATPVVSRNHVIVGATITMLRLEKGFGNSRDLAYAAGISTRKLSQIERGEQDAALGDLLKLSGVLGVTLPTLLERLEYNQ